MVAYKDVEVYYNKCYKKDVVGKVSPLKIEEGVRPYEAYEYVLDILKVKDGNGLRLLDIACGRGFLLMAASKKGFITSGIDISDEAVKLAKQNSPQSVLKVGVAEKLQFKTDYFDAVFCLGSLEHFLDQKKAVNEIKRVSKDNALIYIMVPNKDFIYYKFSSHEGTHQHEIQETLRTNKEWIEFFNKNGLRVIKVFADDYNLKQHVFSDYKPLFVLRRSILRVISLFLPLKWSYQFLYVCKKANS